MRHALLAVAAVLLSAMIASAEVPQVIGYQGRITEDTGVPVANGTYSMQFRIYDAETGGTLLWDSGALSVETNSGVFSIMLGESPQDSIDLPFDEDYWLLVTFRGQDQLPRSRFASAGYAYMASGLVPGTEVSGSVGGSWALKVHNAASAYESHGVYGSSEATAGGAGVYGEAPKYGVYGKATATDGEIYGVYGINLSTWTGAVGVYGQGLRAGVRGLANASSGNAWGVQGGTYSTSGHGVSGTAYATVGYAHAVYGRTFSSAGCGVLGLASATSGTTHGVYGETDSPDGHGVYGYGSANSGNSYGVYGKTDSPTGYAGYFQGDARVTGDLTVDGTLNASVSDGDWTVVGNNMYAAVPGSVGVGVSSPEEKLHVDGNLRLEAGTDVKFGLTNTRIGESGNNLHLYSENDTYLRPYDNVYVGVRGGSDWMVLDGNNRRVGIGTVGPTSTLDVEGEAVVGSGYAGGGATAPTDGMLVEGDMGVGTSSTSSLAKLTVVNTRSDTETRAVYGRASSYSGSKLYGVYGQVDAGATSPSQVGSGVIGHATESLGGSWGVYGKADGQTGRGLVAYASHPTGNTYGVWAKTLSTAGYAGYFEGNTWVTGDMTVDGNLSAPNMGDITAVNAGTGLDGGGTSGDVTLNVSIPLSLSASVTTPPYAVISGTHTATSGAFAYGVLGESQSSAGKGVYGRATATEGGTGVLGETNSGRGVYGRATSTSALDTTYGVYGITYSPSGYGVYGTSPGGCGVYGEDTAASGTNYGVLGRTCSTAGRGVYGLAVATTGHGWGVRGESNAPSGTGVAGHADASTGYCWGGRFSSYSPDGGGVFGLVDATTAGLSYGGWFQSKSTEGTGVYGHASANTGLNYGGWFRSESPNGRAVYGLASAESGTNYGGKFESDSPDGYAVYGLADAGSGTNYGVYGETDSPLGYGVYGSSPGGYGVYGEDTANTGESYGVYGTSESGTGGGVYGEALAQSGHTYGGVFYNNSTEGAGLRGQATADSGYTYGGKFYCSSSSGCAVYGYASADTGITYGAWGWSRSNSGRGVYGYASVDTGVTYGVYGRDSSTSGWGVYYSGGLAGTGSKSCVVKTSQGPRLLYCQESPENWFEDFGEGQLVNGRARIELDPLFLETVTIDQSNPMKVFVQLRDDCNGTYVNTGAAGFDVVELRDGTSNAEFAYRVVAKRKGFEEKRLDFCRAAKDDPYLSPEIRNKQRREHEEERARMEEERVRRAQERGRMDEERRRRREQSELERQRMQEERDRMEQESRLEEERATREAERTSRSAHLTR